MNLYKGNNWKVVFVDWCQEFPGDCIISCDKEKLSDLTKEEKEKMFEMIQKEWNL